jgi:4-diphosphocytidyl-2-C-methyl-D-erythritol kinase
MHDFQTFLAPAKINLFLHITGQRADGYHTLQSVFQLLDFYDTIHLKVTKNNEIKRVNHANNSNYNVPASQCLCALAASALQCETGCKFGVEYAVDKRIPMGGGLGGGSSDAATVLLALNHLWQTNLSRQDLMRIGLTLGADVPVFIFGQTAWAEGIGEILSPVNLPKQYQDQYYVVITPLIHVSTAQVFANSSLTKDTKPLKIADFSSGAFMSSFRNDLEKTVCEEFPAVATTFNWLKPYGKARMSGSGASVFVAVETKKIADELLAKLPANSTGFVAKGLIRHPHYDLVN